MNESSVTNKWIGQNTSRPGGADKVTGLPGMKAAMVVATLED